MKNKDIKKYEFLKNFPLTWEVVLSGGSEKEISEQSIHEVKEMTLERRERTTLSERFKKIDEEKSYRLCDLVFTGDKIVIKSRPNMLTSTLDLEYSNTDFECDVERTSISNCDFAWQILFNINRGCSANVFYQVWDSEGENSKEVPLLESRPYKYRNERGLFNKYK
tara:strand:+ start:72 stop:569 length:498 start_codon:yes stop_codon:yes gene_type:complete